VTNFHHSNGLDSGLSGEYVFHDATIFYPMVDSSFIWWMGLFTGLSYPLFEQPGPGFRFLHPVNQWWPSCLLYLLIRGME